MVSTSDFRKCAVIIKNKLKENYGIEIHVSAVRGLLNLCDLLGRRLVKKIMLSTKNRKNRVAFAKRLKKKQL